MVDYFIYATLTSKYKKLKLQEDDYMCVNYDSTILADLQC